MLAKIGGIDQKTNYKKTSVVSALNCNKPSFGHLLLLGTPKSEAFLYLYNHAKPIVTINGFFINLFTSKVNNAQASRIRDFFMNLTSLEGTALKSITDFLKGEKAPRKLTLIKLPPPPTKYGLPSA